MATHCPHPTRACVYFFLVGMDAYGSGGNDSPVHPLWSKTARSKGNSTRHCCPAEFLNTPRNLCSLVNETMCLWEYWVVALRRFRCVRFRAGVKCSLAAGWKPLLARASSSLSTISMLSHPMPVDTTVMRFPFGVIPVMV